MICFPDFIRRNAFQSPQGSATHFEGRDFTWAEMNERVHGIARAMIDLGLQRGDRVAFLGLNSHWQVEMYFAPSVAGAIAVPMNYRLSEDEMVALLADCSPFILFVDRHFQKRALSLTARLPKIKHLIFADWDAPTHLPADTLTYDDLVASDPSAPPERLANRGSCSDETMILFYTSGTTGVPKGVMLSHTNFFANAMGTGAVYDFGADDVVLLSGPLFHVATGSRVFLAILHGARLVVEAKFEVAACMRLIETQRVTTMTLVPTMLQMILDAPDFQNFDSASLRCLTYGSAPMPLALMQRLLREMPNVTFAQGYGMTEAAPVIAMLPREDHVPVDGQLPKLASVGLPMASCDIRIIDGRGAPCPTGATGQITVRGPQIMKGYWNRSDETEAAFREGFYLTGDAGYFDAEGYLYLAGRTKEMIVSGGENVYPIETENCLAKHPSVASVAVLGLPDARWGEIVFAAIALKPGENISEEDLVAYCKARIARYKVPKKITFWNGPLPLSAANKIDKLRIRAMVDEA